MGNFHFTVVFKSIAYVKRERKATDVLRITFCFKPFGIKKINALVVPSNKSTHHFTGIVTNCLEPDLVLGPPVLPHWSKALYDL
jgi:hypothetical protein